LFVCVYGNASYGTATVTQLPVRYANEYRSVTLWDSIFDDRVERFGNSMYTKKVITSYNVFHA